MVLQPEGGGCGGSKAGRPIAALPQGVRIARGGARRRASRQPVAAELRRPRLTPWAQDLRRRRWVRDGAVRRLDGGPATGARHDGGASTSGADAAWDWDVRLFAANRHSWCFARVTGTTVAARPGASGADAPPACALRPRDSRPEASATSRRFRRTAGPYRGPGRPRTRRWRGGVFPFWGAPHPVSSLPSLASRPKRPVFGPRTPRSWTLGLRGPELSGPELGGPGVRARRQSPAMDARALGPSRDC
jgi:hypothetical protein